MLCRYWFLEWSKVGECPGLFSSWVQVICEAPDIAAGELKEQHGITQKPHSVPAESGMSRPYAAKGRQVTFPSKMRPEKGLEVESVGSIVYAVRVEREWRLDAGKCERTVVR